MLKSIIPIGLILLNVYGLSAQSPGLEQSAFEHLLTVNEQWLKHQEKTPKGFITFNSDEERIALHLQLVAEALQRAEIRNLAPHQKQERADLIDTLMAYAQRGIFPINSFHRERRPYFIDQYNTHCAVGYLMKASGHAQLALNIHEQYNYDYIRDIQIEGVALWASEHGFSLHELAWIQPTYGHQEPIISDPPIGRLHGTVKQKIFHEHQGVLGTVAIGDFDTVWNNDGTWQLSNGFAFFSQGKWLCIGNELQGNVKRIFHTSSGGLIAEGNFAYRGNKHSVVFLDPQLGLQFPLAANEDLRSKKRFTHASLGKLNYFGCYSELGKGTYIMAIEGKGKANLVAFIAGYVHSLSIEANHTTQNKAAHNVCIAGSFDSLSFSAYRKGHGITWIRSNNLVIAQLKDPIKVSLKKEPNMYLVDTAFEYEAIRFQHSAHGTIAQSVLKKGTVYNVSICEDTTKTPACLSTFHIAQPLKPAFAKRVEATVEKPFRLNDEVYFDGKRLRIQD